MAQYAGNNIAESHGGSERVPEFSRWGDLEIRRWRIGGRARIFDQWLLESNINIRPDFSPFYLSLYDAHLTWVHSPMFQVIMGKSKIPFTSEYDISSVRILTLERSLLTNQVITTPLTGVTVRGENDLWRYRLGIYANDMQPLGEFSKFDQGAAVLTKLSHNFAKPWGLDHAWVGIDSFLHTEPTNNGGPPYTRAFALTGDLEKGRARLVSDILWSGGAGPENLGVMLMPSWRISEKWQAVFRYHFAVSSRRDGLAPSLRYDRLDPSTLSNLPGDGLGDRLQTLYFGLNYYIRGHQMKIMNGVEYQTLSGGNNGGGYHGWTYFTGFRMFF
jgi:phosphate-selective porin OprO/OprP